MSIQHVNVHVFSRQGRRTGNVRGGMIAGKQAVASMLPEDIESERGSITKGVKNEGSTSKKIVLNFVGYNLADMDDNGPSDRFVFFLAVDIRNTVSAVKGRLLVLSALL